jgi:hypothetical protein
MRRVSGSHDASVCDTSSVAWSLPGRKLHGHGAMSATQRRGFGVPAARHRARGDGPRRLLLPAHPAPCVARRTTTREPRRFRRRLPEPPARSLPAPRWLESVHTPASGLSWPTMGESTPSGRLAGPRTLPSTAGKHIFNHVWVILGRASEAQTRRTLHRSASHQGLVRQDSAGPGRRKYTCPVRMGGSGRHASERRASRAVVGRDNEMERPPAIPPFRRIDVLT